MGLARNAAGRGLGGARIGEEVRPGHQRGKVDIRPGDLAHPTGPRDVAEGAKVVGHVANRGDPAIEIPAQHRLGLAPVRRCGQVHVGIDQAGHQVLAMQIDDLGLGGLDRPRRVGKDAEDALTSDQHVHVRPRGRAGPVNKRGVTVEDEVGALGRREGRGRPCICRGPRQRSEDGDGADPLPALTTMSGAHFQLRQQGDLRLATQRNMLARSSAIFIKPTRP